MSTVGMEMNTYRFREGTSIALGKLALVEKDFLRTLRRMVKGGSSYFDIERFALGPGSPALQGRTCVDMAFDATPLYRVAEDIVTRAGIDQGLILAPEHEGKRVLADKLKNPLCLPLAAEIMGITRDAACKAVKQGRLPHVKIGNVLLVQKADAVEYRRAREAARRAPAGKPAQKRTSRS